MPPAKYDRATLQREHDRRRSLGEKQEDIAKDIVPGGMPLGTLRNILSEMRRKSAQPATSQEPPMPENIVEVLSGQLSIDDADTPAAVHYGAVHEFDRLPDGYAKVIQPMREYTEAEDFALKKSVELYGFIGAIVRDQYGRILDGNQRSRVAHWFGKGCPFTTTHVRDDEHARDIARALNAIRRHYPREQRETLARELRDQGFSYREIASALDVSVNTIQRDVAGVLKSTPESEVTEPPVLSSTPDAVNTDSPVLFSTPESEVTEPPTPEKRTRGRDQKSYPAQRPTGTKIKTPKAFDVEDIGSKIKNLYMDWLKHCETEDALETAQFFLNTLSDLAQGRGTQLQRQ